jgi:capsular polysaccharide transport system permease protein
MVEFVRRAQAVSDAAATGVPGRAAARLAAFLRSLNIWFWAIVGLPTLFAGVYFFAIASDQYMSEVKFIVHSPSKATTNLVSAMISSAAGGTVSSDTYAVYDYLTSRDAARRLERDDDLRTLLSRPEGDPISRFPGIRFWRHDFEALYDSYLRFVSIEIDSASGVSTLQVKAFRPQDAKRIAHSLLTFSEQLVNQLNARARHDALASFRKEVDETEQKIAAIQTRLTAYRVTRSMLDPKSAAAGPVELLAEMNARLASTQAQLNELLRNAPHSPQIRLLRTRIASIEKLIAAQRSKITGNNSSIATALGDYERLEVQLRLAEKTLSSAFASLEAAKLEAQRQQIYLETIEQPGLPDYPLYPKRFASFGIVTISCMLFYGIAWLLVAGVREHAGA